MNDLQSYIKLNSYQDKSIVCLIPTRGKVDVRVVDSWFRLITPVNHAYSRLFVEGGEIADSYNTAILGIINHPVMSTARWLFTMEDDNIPPPDGLLKLVSSMLEAEANGDKYHAISGLYWTKPSRDQIEYSPIAFGCPDLGYWNLVTPELKDDGSVTPCCLIPQGFTLYDMNLFKEMPYPWFKTIEEFDPSQPVLNQQNVGTQDSFFFKQVFDAGYKVGCRADIKVGHLDTKTGQIW